jgi:hypothetical protein
MTAISDNSSKNIVSKLRRHNFYFLFNLSIFFCHIYFAILVCGNNTLFINTFFIFLKRLKLKFVAYFQWKLWLLPLLLLHFPFVFEIFIIFQYFIKIIEKLLAMHVNYLLWFLVRIRVLKYMFYLHRWLRLRQLLGFIDIMLFLFWMNLKLFIILKFMSAWYIF